MSNSGEGWLNSHYDSDSEMESMFIVEEEDHVLTYDVLNMTQFIQRTFTAHYHAHLLRLTEKHINEPIIPLILLYDPGHSLIPNLSRRRQPPSVQTKYYQHGFPGSRDGSVCKR